MSAADLSPSFIEDPLRLTDSPAALDAVVATMRELSRQTDPQEMVRAYARRMEQLRPGRKRISLSRRGLEGGRYRVTRFSGWESDVDPWREPEKLPLHTCGLFAELIYGNEPRLFADLAGVDIADDDPAHLYLRGDRSLLAAPTFDGGEALNMVLLAKPEPDAFTDDEVPGVVWLTNLFGRATHNLLLRRRLEDAYGEIDRELKVVGDIQRSLLPTRTPEIATLGLAARYETSARAGGDYYDFFPLPDGRWGILIADVSGHGTPAAVVMSILHSIAHMAPPDLVDPAEFLTFVNGHLTARYTAPFGAFATAFYGVYSAETRELTYSSAGHNPPRLMKCNASDVTPLDGARSLPLGVLEDVRYESETVRVRPGAKLVLYTDGIVEAPSPDGELFGERRLDKAVEAACRSGATNIVESIVGAVDAFTGGAKPADDRTLVVGTVR
ncbi:MAG: PP2C family protein-serine/threonine phosphatase [Planctomycetota bacterium]